MSKKIKPFNNHPLIKKNFLAVSDGHKLYYEVCGNPKGKPILVLHGGPGAGFGEKDKRFFDPKVWKIILFDQRGAGRSIPFASLENNTTPKLVEDINMFLDFLKIDKTFIFGGSWGSTLSLVYAITNPSRVLGLILRGIWLANKESNKYYLGGGVKNSHPEVLERLVSLVPKNRRGELEKYYLEQMNSNDEGIKNKYTYAWAYYELSIMKMKTSAREIKKALKDFSYKSLAPLEAHYIVNSCFIEENFILKNAKKISHIPSVIVHGRYDLVCAPKDAYKLHKKLKNSRLHLVTAGHSASEKEIEKKLLEEVQNFSFQRYMKPLLNQELVGGYSKGMGLV